MTDVKTSNTINSSSAPDIARLRGRANRGFEHVFLKNALAETPDVTTVEAGNVFSPGAWTCGISVVWRGAGGWYSVEDVPLETIGWRFEDGENGGIAPVLASQWASEELRFHSRLTHLGGIGAAGVDYAQIEVRGGDVLGKDAARIGVLVRDIKPAGGPISGLSWDETRQVLAIGNGPQLFLEGGADSVEIWPAADRFDAPAALFCWNLSDDLAPLEIKFRVEHGFGDRSLGNLAAPVPHGPAQVDAGFERARADWGSEVPVRIGALSNLSPLSATTLNAVGRTRFEAARTGKDARIARVWELSCHHLLAASEAGTARIGALNYPHLWLRDGVLVARAFDLMGRHDLARIACDEIAPQIFAGGFGAESDAPGQGIWALVSHARQTDDFAWLERQWPHISARLDWIEAMLTTRTPLFAVGTGRIPAYLETPAINVVCLPAQNGVISGRMDWHEPNFFINCWSVRGLRDGAFAAGKRGDQAAFERWNARADDLETALFGRLLLDFGNPRDAIITPYPSETLTAPHSLPFLKERFAAWFGGERLDPNGARRREELWTYFEVAQIHNAFRLGLVEKAWICLDTLLGDELEVGAYIEGKPGGNEWLPFGNGAKRRGWLDPKTARGGNMPHGWTCAEIINLLHFLSDSSSYS